MHDYARNALASLAILILALGAAPPAAGQTPPATTPKLVVDLESSSHVVRREEDRLNLRYQLDRWDLGFLYARLTPRFRDGQDQFGFSAATRFGKHDLTAVVRHTDKPSGEDLLTSLRWETTRSGGAELGGELTLGQVDLGSDGYLLPDDEEQIVARAFWNVPDRGWELTATGVQGATFDVMRGTRELLERLPRIQIAGAETLAELDLDEGRIEDSFGLRAGYRRGLVAGTFYLKAGEQLIRGVPEADDFTGYGGELRLAGKTWSVRTEVDLRDLDSADGVSSFHRGRIVVDYAQRRGRWAWGLGAYLNGESESLSEIPDLYETAGAAVSGTWELDGERALGAWLMVEEDAPDVEQVTRLAFLYRTAANEYGVGVRRDKKGRSSLAQDDYGPFFFGRLRLPHPALAVDGHVGYIDGTIYGKLSIGFRR